MEENIAKKQINIVYYIAGCVIVWTLVKILFILLFPPPIKEQPVAPAELPQLHFDDLQPIKLEK